MSSRKNRAECSTQRARCILDRVRLPVSLGVLILFVSCGPSSPLEPSRVSTETPLAPMLVADLGVDIIVEDIDTAQGQFDFVQELGGYITVMGTDDENGTERMTVEFRVPHKYTGHVADILKNEFGEVTSINAFAADASVRNARLQHELAVLEESLGDHSGADCEETRDRIELLRDMIAFQLERQAFLFVVVHLIESQ